MWHCVVYSSRSKINMRKIRHSVNRVEWRSRASLIMYRDAFKPRSIDRNETEITKEKELEKPIAAKVEKTVTRQPEQRDASPDTDAASSITMSDNEMSAKGDEGELDLEDQSTGDKGLDVENKKIVDSDNTGKGKGDGSSVDTVKSPVIEHVVKVRDEVQKIETQALNDETDSQLNGNVYGEVVSNEESAVIHKVNNVIKEKNGGEVPLAIAPDVTSTKSPSPVKEVMSSTTTRSVEVSMIQQTSKSPTDVDSPQDNMKGIDGKSSDTVNIVEVQSLADKQELSKTESTPVEAEKEIVPKATEIIDNEKGRMETIQPLRNQTTEETENSKNVIKQVHEKELDTEDKPADVEKVELTKSQEITDHLLKSESDSTVMVKEIDLVNANVKSSNNTLNDSANQMEDKLSESDMREELIETSQAETGSSKSSPEKTTAEMKLESLTTNMELNVVSSKETLEKQDEIKMITKDTSSEIISSMSKVSDKSEKTPNNIISELTNSHVVDQNKMPESQSEEAKDVDIQDKAKTSQATVDKNEEDFTDDMKIQNEKCEASDTEITNIKQNKEMLPQKDVQDKEETVIHENVSEKSEVLLASVVQSQTKSNVEVIKEVETEIAPSDQISEKEIVEKQETIEKSEDKILESVVQSKFIEKTQQDTARIEMSPTKELPDSLPGTKMDNDTKVQTAEPLASETDRSDSKSPTIVKPDFPDKFPQSQSAENIEDDKTPEDENSKPSETNSKPSADPLTEGKETSVPSSKIEETPQSLGIADVQLADSISSSIDNTQVNEEQKLESEMVHTISDRNDCISERTDKKLEETLENNEPDIMTQSFIASNGLLVNGYIKDEHVTDGKATIESSDLAEKSQLKLDQEQRSLQDDSEQTDQLDKEPIREEGALQDKIENLLLNGQGMSVWISVSCSLRCCTARKQIISFLHINVVNTRFVYVADFFFLQISAF